MPIVALLQTRSTMKSPERRRLTPHVQRLIAAILIAHAGACESAGTDESSGTSSTSTQRTDSSTSETASQSVTSTTDNGSNTGTDDCNFHHVNCVNDGDCPTNYSCYHASEFGDCLPSHVDCSRDPLTQECTCISSADCEGSKCIASSDFPPKQCPNSPEHTCRQRIKCSAKSCGALRPVDTNGCLRTACDESRPCGANQICYTASDWGLCNSSHFTCSDINGSCECASTDDCNGSYCVEEADAASHCEQFTTMDACQAANADAEVSERPGRCAWLSKRQVTTKGGSCEVAMESGTCVTMRIESSACPENPGCSADARLYYRLETESDIGGYVIQNTAPCGQEPLGYAPCSAGSDVAICKCACGG